MPPRNKSPSPSPQNLSQSSTPTTTLQGNSSMTSFADILNTPSESVEQPKPIPTGMYIFLVDGPHETGESNQKKTPFIRFNLKIMQPHENVQGTDEEIQKALGKKLSNTIYFSETNQELATFQLKQFLDNCGVEATGSLGQRMSQAPGQQVIGIVEHETTQPTDGSEPMIMARVRRFAKV